MPDTTTSATIASAELLAAHDLTTETLLSLVQAARRIPSYRAKRDSNAPAPCNSCTVWRWIRRGIRVPGVGVVRLEGVRLGGRWLTSVEALARFAARQTPLAGAETAAPRTTGQRRKAADRAGAALEKMGV